jgi:ABC-type lipoprotein export system ATPase subunit
MLLLENVQKTYRQPNGEPLPILNIPYFAVNEGEQLVLLGRSGGGKTTLLHAIAGISAVDSGQILFDKTDICQLREHGRDRFRALKIGYVFQTFNLLPGFSALENVTLGMTLARGEPNTARATKLLERVGLSHRLHHKPTSMSVGEQQRVAVARALGNRPRLVLADEPTANIDPRNQQKILNLIRETCREENIALILVTHSMEVAKQFERVVQLSEINKAAQDVPVET